MTIHNDKSDYTPMSIINVLKLSTKHPDKHFFQEQVLYDNSTPDPTSRASLILLKRRYFNYKGTEWLQKRSFRIKKDFLNKLFAKGDVFCFYCKKKLARATPEKQYGENICTIDHKISIKNNPELAKDVKNFVPACPHCNTRKGNKT